MEKTAKIAIAIILSVALLFFLYSRIGIWHKRQMVNAVKGERTACQEKIGVLEEKIANLEEIIAQQKETLLPKEKLDDAFGEEAAPVSPLKTNIACGELEHRITTLTTYLDSKGYQKFYKIKESIFELLQNLIKELSATPPVVTYEMDDLLTLIRNVTHFYRVVGRKRIRLMNDILKNESEIIEPAMVTFFAWLSSGTHCGGRLDNPPSLEILYKYAGFFLNTLGGRSYLLRRGSKVRVLLSYYAVLILDQANEKSQNPFGIDIRPYIGFSFYDISSQKGLIYQKEYLAQLSDLMQKYQM